MERLLQYVWKYKLFPLAPLMTTDGMPVEVIDAGRINSDAGPDFFNAKLKIGGTMWAGQVEVHERSSDWYRHGHQHDRAYDTVVLHVVGKADTVVTATNGRVIPQLELACPEGMMERYNDLRKAEVRPPCFSVIATLPRFVVHSWLTALMVERCERKAGDITARLELLDHRWEDAFFATLARSFGTSVNSDTFEAWAMNIPYRAVDKHRDSLFQVEAIFFGQSGLLSEENAEADDYYRRLQAEHRYLSRKFSMPAPLTAERWKLARMRPGNFPHIRIAQLAMLYHTRQSLVSRILDARALPEVRELLSTEASSYWETHYTFGHTSPKRPKRVGDNALNLIVINTVVPFLFAYGKHKRSDDLCERASLLLESLKPEDNYIVRQWAQAGIAPAHAADSQALIQLQKEYCDKRYCLRCRIGYEYLKGRRRR